ncbi:MAG: hypothetical protein ABI281_05720 [Caldimonas sp.]
MQASTAFWHIVNFLAPAFILGGIAAVATRWAWRHELIAGKLWQFWLAAGLAAASVEVVGLLVFGHDGKMITYAFMVAASAAALWLACFRSRRR